MPGPGRNGGSGGPSGRGGPHGGFPGGPPRPSRGPQPVMGHHPPMRRWERRPPRPVGCCGCFGPMAVAVLGVVTAIALLLF